MDLENTWQKSGGSDEMLNRLLLSEGFNNIHSKLPLKKLKNNLLSSILWAGLITTVYIVLLCYISIWQVNTALGIMILFNTWIMIDSWRLYKNTNDTISSSSSLKEELEKNYSSFKKWWSIQEKVSLFVYPVAVAGGFILGGVLGSGKAVKDFLYNSTVLIVLAITIVILVPACHYMAKWMFNYAYGKHLKKLKLLIDELTD